jgi:hypothetical protein
MREFGIPNKLVNVVKMTLEGSKCRVKNSLRLGDPVSKVLFNIVLEKSSKRD